MPSLFRKCRRAHARVCRCVCARAIPSPPCSACKVWGRGVEREPLPQTRGCVKLAVTDLTLAAASRRCGRRRSSSSGLALSLLLYRRARARVRVWSVSACVCRAHLALGAAVCVCRSKVGALGLCRTARGKQAFSQHSTLGGIVSSIVRFLVSISSSCSSGGGDDSSSGSIRLSPGGGRNLLLDYKG